jgi:hypothetical protein
MFDIHQKEIGAWSRQSPENFRDLMRFVILTIRNPLHRVEADTETALRGGQDALGVLYGWKYEAWQEFDAIAERTLSYLENVNSEQLPDNEKSEIMIEYLSGLRGFGLAKAGFVIQLAYGLCGCLDTHNLTRFNIKPSAFQNIKGLKTAKGRRRKIKLYVDTCYEQGGPEFLWDSWCRYVAHNQPRSYLSPFHVSEIHVECLPINPKG